MKSLFAKKTRKICGMLLVLTVLGFSAPSVTNATAMTSNNYRIESDAVSGGALNDAQSASYGLQSTLGEFFATSTTSTNYMVKGGFWGTAVEGTLSLSLSDTSMSLGTLSASAVNTDSFVATVTSTASRGYALSIISDGALRSGGNTIAAVSDGAVTAGSAEYGFTTAGADGQYNATDTSISDTTYKTVAQNSDAVAGRQTTVSFKASMSDGSTAGTYSQTVTLVLTANF
jgi:hypothetical protein